MKKLVAGVAWTCGAALLGCDPVIVDVTPDHQLQSGPSVAATGGGSTPSNALAWMNSDALVPASDDPDALVLSLASFEQSQCGFVLPSNPDACVDEAQLVLTIPPELNRPALISLDDPRILFSSTRHFAECGGGGGFGMSYGGTLEIVSSDASAVTVKLLGARDPAFDGEHVAARCGTEPPPFALRSAVAVRGSTLSGDPSSGTGPVADPDALYVFVGTTPGTCAEPHPVVDCTENSQMVLRLPPALQTAGEVALNDPQVDAVYTSPMNSCAPEVSDGGTMTILAASETSLTARVFGSGWAMLDGDYDVAICP
jgi:hypothetical protein